MKLSALVARFTESERAAGNIIGDDATVAQAIAAVSFYAGYAQLVAREGELKPYKPITTETEITESEWAIARPLFILYVERESALQLEASRGLMLVDVFGRASSEVAGDIAQMEAELPRKAFFRPIITV